MHIAIETIQSEHGSMKYFRFGRGRDAMVILPGLSIQSVTRFADDVVQGYDLLADEFTVYVLDRRDDVPDPYPVEQMAEDTAEALQALGLHNVCLFGASQGGMMAQVLAIRHPELVRSMVLGSTSSHVTDEQYRVLDRWVQLARQRDREGLLLDFAEKIYPGDVFQQIRPAMTAAAEAVTEEELQRFILLAEGTRGFRLTEDLPQIRCPVLILGDEEDAVLGAQASVEIAKAMESRGNCALHLYSGYGHAAFDTAPDYRKRMLDFFRHGIPAND